MLTSQPNVMCQSGIRIPGIWMTLLCPFLSATGLGLAGSAQQRLLFQPPGHLIKTYNQDKQPLTLMHLMRIAITENAMTEKGRSVGVRVLFFNNVYYFETESV